MYHEKLTYETLPFDFSNYDAVGFATPSSAIYSIIQKVKQASIFSKDTLLLAGGIHASIFPEQVIQDLGLDLVCIGEGEETLKEILSAQNRDFKKINGIVYRNGDSFVRTSPRAPIKDLDTLPLPARHLVPTDGIVQNFPLFDGITRKTSYIACSRGCNGNCAFCANLQKGIRYRSGGNIKEELQQLKKQYGIQSFFMYDSCFTTNKAKVKSICEAIKPLDLKWDVMAKASDAEPEILAIMKDAGCSEIEFGIESGSQKILDATNKRTTVEQNKKAIALAREVGIKATALIIHGFPGEDDRSTQETINFLEETEPDRVLLSRFVPMPGSPIYMRIDKAMRPNNDDIFHFCKSAASNNKEIDASYARLAELAESLNM